MKLLDVVEIKETKQDSPIHYRKSYSAVATFEDDTSLPFNFVMEMNALGMRNYYFEFSSSKLKIFEKDLSNILNNKDF